MNTRKFNIELMEMDFESVMEMVELIDDDPFHVPEEQTAFYIVKVVSKRKRLNDTPNVNDKKVFIKIVCDTLTKIPLNELKKKAKKQDSQALLTLGDCHFFGLKGLDSNKQNRAKAKGFYLSSANLNNPEAMTMVAYCCYSELLERVDLTDNPDLEYPTCQVPTLYLSIPSQPLPNVQIKTSIYENLLKEMWDWLEKCVSLDWVSTFLIEQAQDVQTIRYEEERLRPSIKRELVKYNVEQFKKTQEKFRFSCGNPFCKFKFDSEFKLSPCLKCNSIKYCSDTCQLAHRDKHKDICIQAESSAIRPSSATSKIDDSTPRKSIFTINGPNNETFIYETNTASLNGIKFFQHLLKPEEAENVVLAETRLASIRNVQMNEIEIKQEIDRLINRASYPSAIKFINLAIDRLRLSNPTSIKKQDQIKFIDLYYKRVECYLKIADIRRAPRFKQLALDDCVIVLETGIFEKLNCESYKKLEQIKAQLENEQIIRTNMEPIRRRRRQRRYRYRQNEQFAISDEFECSTIYGVINVTTCFNLIKNKMAVNSQIDMDFCPICSTEWTKFIEPSLAVILPCNHAFCAKCILTYSNICKKSNKKQEDEEDIQNDSCCSLCRNEFSPMYLDEICSKIYKERVVDSFFELLSKLPFNQEEGEKLISNLLIKNEFDVNKINDILFKMVGMVQAESIKDLDNQQKQEYFELARAPVKKLSNEYYELKKEIDSINDTTSIEWESKYRKLEDVKQKLNAARQNAANDIYERMNSSVKMGCESDYKKMVQVDLHGLYVKEAIEKVQELLIPILSILDKIMIITGHGLHNKSGEAVLKNKLKEFLEKKGVKIEDVNGNEGAIFIYNNS